MKDITVDLIGKVLDDHPEAERDAIHIAVLPMIAGEVLMPGRLVKINEDGLAYPVRKRKDAIGIVDPFLSDCVNNGQKCFIFLFPGSITSLKHHWVHPLIPEGLEYTSIAAKVASVLNKEHEEWLREFALAYEIDYDEMIENAASSEEYAYVTAGTSFNGPEGDEYDKFWYHLECLTGKKFNQEHRGNVGWSCSC